MKILHVSSEKGWRGGEAQVMLLIDVLAKKGIECSLLCREHSDLHKFCVKNEILHYTAAFRNSFDLETAFFIKKVVKEGKYDILHLHAPKAHTLSVMAGILGLKVPMVLTKRTAFKIKRNFFTLFKYNYSSIKKIIAISEKIADQLREIIKENNKIEKIYSGINLENYAHEPSEILGRELHLLPNTKVIGIVAALSPEKDHLTFIKMAEVLFKMNPDFRFVIIGKGKLEKSLKEDVAERDMQDVIYFTGHRSDIYRILPELDVLLLTSLEEGLGSVILDAFASKVPVVATNTGGIPELVLSGKTGMLAPVGDYIAIAECVNKIMGDQILREEIIKNAWNFAQDFSKENMGLKAIALYKSVLN